MSMNLEKTSVLGQDDHQMNAKSIEIIDVENYKSTNSNVEIVNCEAEGNDYALNIHHQKTTEGYVPPPRQNVPMVSKEYQEYLKARLHFECATVRNKSINLGVSRKSDDPSQETWIEERANVVEQPPEEADKVEAATTNKDSNARSRRQLINRESAQRSRKRKVERLYDLEARVSKLEEENSNLLKQQVVDLQRHNQTLRDNALIKEQVARLRSQVYALEEKLKNSVPSRHMSPALNRNVACSTTAQDNVVIRQYPSRAANTLLSGYDRQRSSMTWPLIPNSNINDVNTFSGHDHRQSSLANPPITDRNNGIDNDLDAWLNAQQHNP